MSCKKDTSTSKEMTAFFGGEIINPSSNYIIIYKSSDIIDTVYLDANNRFKYTFTNFDSGLYHFYDGKESQSFLIHPNDSIMIRVNTVEFDESLTFNGIGEKENTYLIDLFLETERQEQEVLKISQLEPEAFEEQLSNIRQQKLEKLKQFTSKYNASELFTTFAKANIDYNYYYSKEAYPFINYSKSEHDIFNGLPDDFFDFRKDIDYNNETLKDYRPYVSFLRFHFNNIALQEHFKHSKDSTYDNQSLDYNLDKLTLIHQKVSDTFIKNRLLYYNMIKFINASKSVDDYDSLLTSFNEKSTNTEHKSKASTLVNSYKRLKPGQVIPDLKVIDKNEKTYQLRQLINKPTIIYFWDVKDRYHLKVSHDRAKELQKKYPEFDILAISINSISSREQADVLQRNHLNLNNEYHFENAEEAIELLSLKPVNKVFILDKHARIVNPKANMFDLTIEHELLALINQ
ncbi:hypothetical protein [Olleya sp. YS]|uniref:hypothetical protein n=1 Tax=Olleya sp. YS TaxID=3028318 RepID=UPI0024345525|nr:hypothetical protein [Olleya sp. YS]WGD34188.1 hypothetical protein Ollyesu_10415 [Olleya sp. YS]